MEKWGKLKVTLVPMVIGKFRAVTPKLRDKLQQIPGTTLEFSVHIYNYIDMNTSSHGLKHENNATHMILSENETLRSDNCYNCRCFGVCVFIACFIFIFFGTVTEQNSKEEKLNLKKSVQRNKKWTRLYNESLPNL